MRSGMCLKGDRLTEQNLSAVGLWCCILAAEDLTRLAAVAYITSAQSREMHGTHCILAHRLCMEYGALCVHTYVSHTLVMHPRDEISQAPEKNVTTAVCAWRYSFLFCP